jgi:hypothetical protein
MLNWMALAERSTVDVIRAPCSVKAAGKLLECSTLPNWSQFATTSSHSLMLNRKTKSYGKRSEFRLTCSFNRLVFTPYNTAKCTSRMTGTPRSHKIGIPCFT